MRNAARTNINLNDFRTCLAATEYALSPETDDGQYVTIYGDKAMCHNGDETVIISAAAGRRMVREMRATAKACDENLRITEYAAGECCTCDHSQESN